MVWQMTMVIISRYSKRLLLLVNTDCPSLNYQKDPTHPIKSKWPFQIVSKYLHQESWFRMMMIKVTKVRLVKISAFSSNPSPPPILNTLIDQSGETQPLFSTRPPIFFTFLRFSIQPPNCLWNPYFQSDPTSWVNLSYIRFYRIYRINRINWIFNPTRPANCLHNSHSSWALAFSIKRNASHFATSSKIFLKQIEEHFNTSFLPK